LLDRIRMRKHKPEYIQMTLKLTAKQFDEIVEKAEESIKPGAECDWINASSLIRRAYYLGLINGLKSISSEDNLRKLLINTIQKTMREQESDNIIKEAIRK